MPGSNVNQAQLSNQAQAIVKTLKRQGPSAMYYILPLEDWDDIVASLDFCLAHEDLDPKDWTDIDNLRQELAGKIKAHETRMKRTFPQNKK